MAFDPFAPLDEAELGTVIRETRRRWRARHLLRGATIVASGTLLVLLVSAYALETLKFTPAAVVGLRLLVGATTAALAAWFLARPLLRRATDEQVALYLEERRPTLDGSVVSAVDASHSPSDDAGQSRALVGRIVADALDRCRVVDAPASVERMPVRAYLSTLVGVLVAGALFLTVGPTVLRRAALALVQVSQDVEAASPYRIDVRPGSATVARGADQVIEARLSGFTADAATLVVRQADGATEQRLPMSHRDDGGFEMVLSDVGATVTYFVEAAGVRSAHFRLTAADVPYVKQLDLEYVFPAHTGLPPETVRDGGDIAVLAGTTVHIVATTTMPAPGGRVVFDDGRAVALARQSNGTLAGEFVVEKDGLYGIELETTERATVSGSPQYSIDALDDRAPTVTLTRPQRDVAASPIEEVPVETRAQDDFGVRDLQLVFSVNGGPQKAVTLFRGERSPTREVTAGHTFYLEELGVQPGDFVSYFARVSDNAAGDARKTASSDLYFVRVRPFNKEFSAATSQAGGGGGGGEDNEAMSERQRQIVTATFNLQRDRASMSADKLRENTVILGLSQQRLREQVEQLSTRMKERLVEARPEMQSVAELLPKAIAEMKKAEAQLQARNPGTALAPEQQALQYLQKAEEQYQVQVAQGRNSGGGGGSPNNALSDELAQLFQMELDRLANQYETVQGAEEQQASKKLDELAEKLRDLARRQEQQAERERSRNAANGRSPSDAANQRALADETENAARQLEKLSREQSRPELSETAQRLRQAADAMRRAAANGGGSGQSGTALERMRDAQSQLARERGAQAEQGLEQAAREAEDLARAQDEIADRANGLGKASGRARDKEMEQIGERKDDLQSRVGRLERQLDKVAGELGQGQEDAGRKLREAARGMRDDRLEERIRFSKEVLRRGSAEQVEAFENRIGEAIDAVRKSLGDAKQAMQGGQGGTPTENALDRAGRLARGLDSFSRRLEERRGESQGAGGGALSGDDVRQFSGEARRWQTEAQQLQRELGGARATADPQELERLLKALRSLATDQVFRDPGALGRLEKEVADAAKRFEFALRRAAGANAAPPTLAATDEVPEGYRGAVEEYYRSLSRVPPRK